MATLCLNMIVKNEGDVIKRCLGSVLPWVDHWMIVERGSEDGTQAIIQEHLKSVPGKLHERPWVDFAHNGTEALEEGVYHTGFSRRFPQQEPGEILKRRPGA